MDTASEQALAHLIRVQRVAALGDFVLVRIQPTGARHVAGFARAFNLGPEQLQQVSRLP